MRKEKKVYKTMITLYLETDTKDKLESLAKQFNISVSYLIKIAIKEMLNQIKEGGFKYE